MLKTKKKLLITIALLLIVTLGVSVAAYTLAGVGNGDSQKINSEVTQRSSKLSDMTYKTNIDLIAEDSANDNYCYNIVHMIPASMQSGNNDYSANGIDTYVSSGNFKDMVINKNVTGTAKMNANKVRVITLPVKPSINQKTKASEVVSLPSGFDKSVDSYTEDYSIASLLSDADLLYIESPNKSSYIGNSAMSDDLYSFIMNTYVGTKHKPIILDDYKNTSDTVVAEDGTYRSVINQISDRYLYSPVFSWTKSQNTESFLKGEGESHFFAKTLNGKATGKILRIRNSAKTEVVNNADGSVDIEQSRAKALELDWITNQIIKADKSLLYYGNVENYPGYDEWMAKMTQAQYDAASDDAVTSQTEEIERLNTIINGDENTLGSTKYMEKTKTEYETADTNLATPKNNKDIKDAYIKAKAANNDPTYTDPDKQNVYNNAKAALQAILSSIDGPDKPYTLADENKETITCTRIEEIYNQAKQVRDDALVAYEEADRALEKNKEDLKRVQDQSSSTGQANTSRKEVDQRYTEKQNLWNTYMQSEEYYRGGLNMIMDQYKTQETPEQFRTNPAYYQVTDKNAADLTVADLSGTYDFIIIEDSVIGDKIVSDIQNKIISLANGTQYIIFDAANVDPKKSDNDNTANKYAELYNNLVTGESNEPINKLRTLVVKNGFFSNDTDGALTEPGAKKIADIINGSDYRGSESNGRNGKKFKVLEIQPCYPIDEEKALNNGNMSSENRNYQAGVRGNYYQNPGDVIKRAPEEVNDTDDYYAFELSIARIAAATGLKYSQIELDQMSTDEFICKKEVVLDTYDLVYIGGNFSALVPHNLQNIFSAWQADNQMADALKRSERIATNFDMYTHTGGMVPLGSTGVLYGTYYTGGTLDASTPANIGYGVYRAGGSVESTSTLYNGNDLTATKYKELKDYIDAGMPIIFGSDITKAYEAIYNQSQLKKLSNKFIDPTSNMYAVLDYAYKKCAPDKYKEIDASVANNAPLNSIYWGMDVSKNDNNEENSIEWADNTDNLYGSTVRYTRYNQEVTNKIKGCINASNVRPTLQINSAPSDYVLQDPTTHHEAEDGKMTIKVGGLSNDSAHMNMKATLYVDKDGNGSFDEDEAVDTKDLVSQGSSVDLNYEFEQSDFYGLISWKVIATTQDTGLAVAPCDVYKGFAYYKRPDNVEKKEVRTLQIMPGESGTKTSTNKNTLFMCTECQKAMVRLNYNGYCYADSINNITDTESTQGVFGGIYLGKHEHNYGIVKYDSQGKQQSQLDKAGEGSNNWNSNFAADIADDYDFSVDILYLDELQDIANIVKANGTATTTTVDGKEVTTYVPIKMLNADNTLNTNGVDRKDESGNAIDPSVATSDMTWVEYYQALADKYYDLYEQAKEKADKSSAKSSMIDILKELKTQIPENGKHIDGAYDVAYISSPDDVQYWIDNEQFLSYFIYVSGFKRDAYAGYYETWARLHDDVVDYYNLYRKYASYAATEDNWIGNNYDIMVLGFADEFNKRDLSVDECNQIKSYVSNGGTVLLTHDTTSEYANEGSVTLTTQLRDTFGLDRYHATINLEKSPTDSMTVNVPYATQQYYITSPWNPSEARYDTSPTHGSIKNVTYGPITVSGKNVTVKLVKEQPADSAQSIPNKARELYSVASFEEDENSSVVDGKVTVTIECYDTQQDLEAGNKSTSATPGVPVYLWLVGVYNITNTNAYVSADDLKDGVGSVSIDSGASTYSGRLKIPFFEFDNASVDGRAKYYITPISIKQKDNETLEERIIWQNEVAHVGGTHEDAGGTFGSSLKKLSLVGVTDPVGAFRSDADGHQTPYKYAKSNWYVIACDPSGGGSNYEYHTSQANGTDAAEQNNKGIITTYPFTLGEHLKITPTHCQYLSADVEDSNMTIWYSLAATKTGGINNITTAESRSSWYAATPGDGMDNYFMYTYHSGKGTVHYCGAGHSKVTASGSNNNDERRLFVNLAVDAVRNSASRPKITLYDKEHKKVTEKSKNGLKLDSDGNYVYTLSGIDEVPEFDFDVRFSELAGLSDVYMFYDLDYDGSAQAYHPGKAGEENKYTPTYSNKFKDDYNHVLIQHYTSDVTHSKSSLEKNAATNPNDCIGFVTNSDEDAKKLKEEHLVQYTNSNPLLKNTDKKNLLSVRVRDQYRTATDDEKNADNYPYTYKSSTKNNTVLRIPTKTLEDQATGKKTTVGQSKLTLNAAVDTNDPDAKGKYSSVDYFAPYNSYTYLVIYAKDSKGKTAYVRIKIMLTERLFELTQNTTLELPHYYFSVGTKTLDITERLKYNI